jgi:hypothetical protein
VGRNRPASQDAGGGKSKKQERYRTSAFKDNYMIRFNSSFILACLLAILAAPGVAISGEVQNPVSVETVTIVREKSTLILDKLLSLGINKVKGLDLVNLRNQIPQVRWRALAPGETVPDFVGHRTSAFYKTGKKIVTILANPQHINDWVIATIALHESLGALNYDDRNYQISMGLLSMVLPKGDDPQAQNKRAFRADHLVQVAMLDGGATSVGGGGDFIGLLAKIQTLYLIGAQGGAGLLAEVPQVFRYQKNPNATLDYFGEFMKMDFEADYDKDSDLHISFDKRGGLVLNIPARFWLNSSESDKQTRNALAQVTISTIEALFIKEVPIIPAWQPRAKIICKRASKVLTYSALAPIENLESYLKLWFKDQDCKFEMSNDGK